MFVLKRLPERKEGEVDGWQAGRQAGRQGAKRGHAFPGCAPFPPWCARERTKRRLKGKALIPDVGGRCLDVVDEAKDKYPPGSSGCDSFSTFSKE